MIEEEYRLFAFGGGITPGGPSRWDVLDWDQRRTVAVIMDEEVREDEVAEGTGQFFLQTCLFLRANKDL